MSSTSPLSPKHLDSVFSQCPNSDSQAASIVKSSIRNRSVSEGGWGSCVAVFAEDGRYGVEGGLDQDCVERCCKNDPSHFAHYMTQSQTHCVNFHVGGLGSSAATIFFDASHQLQAACSGSLAPHSGNFDQYSQV